MPHENKFVIVNECPIIFPGHINHSEGYSSEHRPQSAGFCRIGESGAIAYGNSMTLKLSARVQDSDILTKMCTNVMRYKIAYGNIPMLFPEQLPAESVHRYDHGNEFGTCQLWFEGEEAKVRIIKGDKEDANLITFLLQSKF